MKQSIQISDLNVAMYDLYLHTMFHTPVKN